MENSVYAHVFDSFLRYFASSMLQKFNIGDQKTYSKTVFPGDIAEFESGVVHPVYATFALTRDAEWSSRLFVLEMKEADEEGIGTFVHVEHHAPAFIGEEVRFTAIIEKLERNEVICLFSAKVGERLIATGKTGQKIIKKQKLDSLFNSIKNN